MILSCTPEVVDDSRTISGTISYIGNPTDVTNFTGLTGTLGIDDDNQYNNDTSLMTFDLSWGNGTSLAYTVDIGTLPDGDYYVFFHIEKPSVILAYGYYNGITNDAYVTRTLVSIRNGVIIDIQIDVT